MLRSELIKQASKTVQDQHDIFLIQFLGISNCGLSAERIKELYDEKLITLDEPGLDVAGLDPYAFLVVLGRIMDRADNSTRMKMRDWSLSDWLAPVKEEMKSFVGQGGQVSSSMVSKPSPTGIIDPLESPSNLPAWMSPSEKASYKASIERAGIYARGLGNQVGEDINDAIAEGWKGTQITQEVNQAQRQFMLDTIKQETANEIMGNRDTKTLAGRLADITKDYSRNWQRIAQTELQAAHNEGRLLNAIEFDSLIARVPETNACESCISLFVGADGNLVLFEPNQLIDNGVNVGRKKQEYKATLFPIHPNCKCDTLPVPRGFYVTRMGNMKRIEAEVSKAIKIPRKYLSGLSNEDKAKRAKEIQERVKSADKKRSYEPMHGDKDAKTKPSKYTRTQLASRVREELKGNSTEEFISVASKLTGVPKRILNQVHKRGAEAWSVGHRPGATQVAWARARVYSFLTGGKTRSTADKDLWQEYLDIKK